MSRGIWTGSLAAGQVALLAGTYFVSGFGAAWWHHLVSLGIVLAAAGAMPGRMRSRRFLGVGILATTVLAAVSGFFLLYWKEGIRIDGYQDWAVWWHVAWSWMAAVFFFQHTWVNRVQFAHFFRRSFRATGSGMAHGGLYALTVAGIAVMAGPLQGAFTNETYIPWSLWGWIAATVLAYGAWFLLRRRPHQDQTRYRGRVDLALVPVAALVVLSGLPLLWFDGAMEAWGLKYASKTWHVWPSIAFSVLVFVHSVQLWAGLRRHWAGLRGAAGA